jgi:glycine cleavage system H protein
MKKFYSKEHQWIEVDENGEAKVGITRYAAQELGEITFIELPEMGASLNAGDRLCTVESVKACSDVFAPAGGTVKTVNSALETDPAALNDDAENSENSWICVFSGVNSADLDALMDEAQYAEFCK